jgi:hypothetical protein
MTAFYILGGVLAGWALLVSFLGIVSKSFPGTPTLERLVAGVSVVLVLGAIGAAVIGSANEEEHEEGEQHEAAALVLPA